MAFQNPFRNLVIPSGAVSGQARIVIGPDLPPPLSTYQYQGSFPIIGAILYYNTADSYAWQGLVDAGGTIVTINGAVKSGVMIEISAGQPAGYNFQALFTGQTVFELDVNAVVPSAQTAFGPIYGANPNSYLAPDAWGVNIVFAPAAGWAGSLKTRQLASPPNTHQVYGGIAMGGGVRANGTVIANITQANRRPITACDIPCSNNNVVGGGETPHLNIQPDGRVLCYGFTASTVGFANGFYSTDF